MMMMMMMSGPPRAKQAAACLRSCVAAGLARVIREFSFVGKKRALNAKVGCETKIEPVDERCAASEGALGVFRALTRRPFVRGEQSASS